MSLRTKMIFMLTFIQSVAFAQNRMIKDLDKFHFIKI